MFLWGVDCGLLLGLVWLIVYVSTDEGTIMEWITRYWKALPALAGVLAQLIAANVLTGSALHYAQVLLAALTALGVVVVPKNAPAG